MKIRMREWEMEAGSSPQELISMIQEKISTDNLLLNSLVVDGLEIFDNFWEYIEEHYLKIKEIEVIAFTREEVTAYFLEQLSTEKKELAEKAEALSDRFYGSALNTEDWDNLINVIERSYAVLTLAGDVENMQTEQNLINNEKVNGLSEKLPLFNEAIAMKDSIYIADLLHFEIVAGLRGLLR